MQVNILFCVFISLFLQQSIHSAVLFSALQNAYEDNQVAQNLRQLPDAILPQQWIEDEVGELRNTLDKGVEQGPDLLNEIVVEKIEVGTGAPNAGAGKEKIPCHHLQTSPPKSFGVFNGKNKTVSCHHKGIVIPNATNGATRNVTGTLTNGTATNFVDDLASTFSLPGAISILSAMGVLVVFCLGVCIFYVYKYIKTDKKFSSDSEETEKLLPKVLPTE